MQNFQNFTIKDFVQNEQFIDWCLRPNKENHAFWHRWLKDNPHRQEDIASAKELVLDLNYIEGNNQAVRLEEEIWENILEEISEPPLRKINYYKFAFKAAAVLTLAICTIWISQSPEIIKHITNSETTNKWITLENTTGLVKKIELSDKSTIILEPFSTLKYPEQFAGEERTVFLEGEAFFDIQRDTLHPFLVYANETITKVLGTSFRINAFNGQETVEVEVTTGKVAVYANVESEGASKQMLVNSDESISFPLPNKKLEVTPNQRVVFNKKSAAFVRKVAVNTKVLSSVSAQLVINYENEKVTQVFKTLAETYGIKIKFNKNKLKNCTITAKINEGTLIQQLDIICAALNFERREQDGIIFIEGEGC